MVLGCLFRKKKAWVEAMVIGATDSYPLQHLTQSVSISVLGLTTYYSVLLPRLGCFCFEYSADYSASLTNV